MQRNIHVVPNAQGGWDAKREKAERASGHYDTQQEAINAAREIARHQGLEVVIHRPNGQIRDKDSYGQDPCPPKDNR